MRVRLRTVVETVSVQLVQGYVLFRGASLGDHHRDAGNGVPAKRDFSEHAIELGEEVICRTQALPPHLHLRPDKFVAASCNPGSNSCSKSQSRDGYIGVLPFAEAL